MYLQFKMLRGLFLIVFVLLYLPAVTQISLPQLFSDNMVLQRDMLIPVWGKAAPYKTISIALASTTKTTTSNAKGEWKIELPSLKAGGPLALTIISGEDKIIFRNILIGDVWICSGQSNMEFPLSRDVYFNEEKNQTTLSAVRLFRMEKDINPTKRKFTQAEIGKLKKYEYYKPATWEVCDSASSKNFSAVAYYFAKLIQKETGIPIGLIQNAVGGSPTEAWISQSAFASNPHLKRFANKNPDSSFLNSNYAHPFTIERIKENLELISQGEKNKSELFYHPFSSSYLFETGIRPLLNTHIKGVLWYQGESNATYPDLHKKLFEMLIKSWRKDWAIGELPFLFVQLPGISNRNRWPEFREGQRELLELSNTGMAVTIDLGDPNDVHPRDKRTVGERLSKIALAKVYDLPIEYSGPVYKNYKIQDSIIQINFDHAAGLQTSDGKHLSGFSIQGYINNGSEEKLIDISNAVIENETIRFRIPTVFSPTKIKYAWAPYPACNLINKERLPAGPFKIELPGSF